jgi:hypothetical protein
MSNRPLFDALEEFKAYRDDLQRSTYQTFESVLARYGSLLKPGEAVGNAADDVLPNVDFDAWWAAGLSTVGGMVGSGKLAWSTDRRERVAIQRALILKMVEGKPDIHDVAYVFFWGGGKFDNQIHEFVSQVIEPFHRDLTVLLNPYVQQEKLVAYPTSPDVLPASRQQRVPFVASERINAFRQLSVHSRFDLRKLIALCEELNKAAENSAWYSVAFLTRAIIDHVPPAFGCTTFAQVVGQVPGKHLKPAAQALDSFARKVADLHLHEPLKPQLSLPNETQMHVAHYLDVVLGEVERGLM